MQPPSEPQIDKKNPKKWFIYFSYDVPVDLWPYHERKRERIKIYDNINRLEGEAKEAYAEERRLVWKYKLEVLNYNPFEEELKLLREIEAREAAVEEALKQKAEEEELSEEEKRKLTPIAKALELFIDSRIERKIDAKSVTTYRNTCTWLLEYFIANPKINVIFKVKHVHISAALNEAAKKRDWSATTINKEIEFAMTIFNWLEGEDYIVKNPSAKKLKKLPEAKKMHKWYDKNLAKKVKSEVLAAGEYGLYRAMAFTYYILIRSKEELRKLKIGDIDRDLKRVRFSDELSKNNTEQWRDYPPEFEKILDDMKLHKYPKDYYVFGTGAEPGKVQMGANYLSGLFKPIKEKLKLSIEYTIYGWKHTRIVHELMKGTDGYEISHMARHGDTKTTKDYQRDYDITLKNVYGPEDLTF